MKDPLITNLQILSEDSYLEIRYLKSLLYDALPHLQCRAYALRECYPGREINDELIKVEHLVNMIHKATT